MTEKGQISDLESEILEGITLNESEGQAKWQSAFEQTESERAREWNSAYTSEGIQAGETDLHTVEYVNEYKINLLNNWFVILNSLVSTEEVRKAKRSVSNKIALLISESI